jgi:alpha-1,6-mannosyltransferase
MSIKTLHLTNCFHAESGGIATFYRELLKGAERLRREIRLVVPAGFDSVQTHGRHGKVYYVAARSSRLSRGYRLLMPRHYLFPNTPLRRILEDEKSGLVECCDKYTMNYMAALLRRGWFIPNYRPAVVGLSCERMDENVAHYISARPAVAPLCQFYMKYLYFPMFDHHIAVSTHVAGELHEASRGHNVRRGVWVRPMGAECDLFHPGRRQLEKRRWLRNLAGAPERALVLLYAGRLVPEKNLGLLLKIVHRLEIEAPGRYRLLIAGDGSERARFEQECAGRAPGAVSFMGHVSDRQTLADVYANCDIFLHPNPGEPFGIAPLEAMASGLPLIAPNSSGLTSYARAGNAWLVDSEPEAYVGAIRNIQGDPDAGAARARAARATAEKFDWAAVTAKFFELYEELHALVRGERAEPLLAPAFFSTQKHPAGYEAT